MSAPRGLIARLLGWAGGLALAAAGGLWILWAIGFFWTDRTLLTQYLFWGGGMLLLAGVVPVGVVGLVLSFCWQPTRRAVRIRRVALVVGALGVTVHGFDAFNVRTLFVRTGPAPRPSATVSILHWNATRDPDVPPSEFLGALAGDPPPDVMIISGYLYAQTRATIQRHVGERASSVSGGGMVFFSRLPIISTRAIEIDVTAARDGDAAASRPWLSSLGQWVFSQAHAAWRRRHGPEIAGLLIVKVDAKATLGRPLVICAIDLPSNPAISRRRAAEIIALQLDKLGMNPATAPELPDVLIGDFNTPHGSYSMSLLAPGMTDAAAAASVGFLATWPRERRMFHIDHAFVASWLRASEYRIVDPGRAEHWAQSLRVTAR
ncbi:MAG: endonuclease/exonuclease/phosphatase family protein [Phycisphaerales bacterium]